MIQNARNPSLSGSAPAFQRYMERSRIVDTAFGEQPSLPSWISDNSQTDASASINQSRGCLELLSTAQGSRAEITTPFYSVDEFDGIYWGAILAHNADATAEGDASTNIGLVTSSVDDSAYHRINDPSSPGDIRIRANGADRQTPNTRDAIIEHPAVTEMIWDTTNGEVIHRYQDAGGVRINSGTLPDPTLDYQIRARCQDNINTSPDKRLDIYALKISYVSFLG